jgi:hypothetical protein
VNETKLFLTNHSDSNANDTKDRADEFENILSLHRLKIAKECIPLSQSRQN